MADLSLLLQALANKQGNYLAENPWYAGGQAVMKTPVYATADTDPLQTALAQALAGFVGSAASAYGKSQATEQGSDLLNQFTLAAQQANQEGGPSFSETLLANPETKEFSAIAALEEATKRAVANQEIVGLRDKYQVQQEFEEPKLISNFGGKDLLYKGQEKIGEAPHQSAFGSGGAAPDSKVGEILAKAEKGTPLTDDELVYIRSSPMPYQIRYENILKEKSINNRFSGANLPEDVRKQVAGAETLVSKFGTIYERIKSVTEDPGNPQARFVEIKASQIIPASEVALVKDWLNFVGLQTAREMLGAQGLSDRDVGLVLGFIANDQAIAAGEIDDRFKFLINNAITGAAKGLRTSAAQPKFSTSAKGVAQDFYSQLSAEQKKAYGGDFDAILGAGWSTKTNAETPGNAINQDERSYIEQYKEKLRKERSGK